MFTADKEQFSVVLNWQTAKEENSNNFNIQRSSDGLHFNMLSKIAASGSSYTMEKYSCTDANVTNLKA